MENIGLVIVGFVVIGFVAFILPKPNRTQSGQPESGMILPDGKIIYKGKVITFAEAKKRNLHLDFAERK
jgi:hypothetical protein